MTYEEFLRSVLTQWSLMPYVYLSMFQEFYGSLYRSMGEE